MCSRVLLALATAALALPVAACGGGMRGGGVAPVRQPQAEKPLNAVGKGEGALNLVAWAGYVEDGSTDPDVDWVSGFEQQTGCQVNARTAATSEVMVELMRTGQYDGVSAPGDATLRLIEAGDVAPVNTDLIKNYPDVFDGLVDQPWNSVDGRSYGVPQGRAANVLMWRADILDEAPESWSAVFDRGSAHAGRVTAYDNPIYIADAALYLKSARPELEIESPYELDDEQFGAVVRLLEEQRSIVGRYWSDYAEERASFAHGRAIVGSTWQVIAELLEADGVDVETTLPDEGATGWSNTWMIAARAAHPNCMYMWMDHVIAPRTNAAIAEWFGEAPSNRKACEQTADEDHCDTFHAGDEAYFDDVAYWITPRRECGDGRGAACKDYADWVRAWRAIRRG